MSGRTASSTTVAALRTTGNQLIELARRPGMAGRRVADPPGWTVPQVLAGLTQLITRHAAPFDDADGDPATRGPEAGTGAGDPRARGPAAGELERAVAALRRAVGSLPSGPGVDGAGPVPYLGALEVPPADLYAAVLGEMLVHGYDIALAGHRGWPIDPDAAAAALRGGNAARPAWVDPARACGLIGRVELRARDQPHCRWQFDEGRLEVAPAEPWRPDVVISAPAAELLLFLHDRMSPWPALATGRVRMWGRRPGLAARTATAFRCPLTY